VIPTPSVVFNRAKSPYLGVESQPDGVRTEKEKLRSTPNGTFPSAGWGGLYRRVAVADPTVADYLIVNFEGMIY